MKDVNDVNDTNHSSGGDFPPPKLTSSRELTAGWARVGLITWIGALLSTIAISVSSRTVGKPPWWLGPSVNPAPIILLAVPLVLLVVPLALFYKSHRHAPRVAMVCAFVLAVVAIVDIGNTPGVAIVEIAIAVAALLGSVATNAGVFTRP